MNQLTLRSWAVFFTLQGEDEPFFAMCGLSCGLACRLGWFKQEQSVSCLIQHCKWNALIIYMLHCYRSDDLYGNVYTETMQYTADILSSTYDWLAGSSNHCPFHENTMISIKEK